MTGMPSFGAIEVPDQETWSIVAFVKRLPSVTDEDYKAWTAPAAPVPDLHDLRRTCVSGMARLGIAPHVSPTCNLASKHGVAHPVTPES